MKKIIILLVMVTIALSTVMAQSRGGNQSRTQPPATTFSGQAFNGATGLYTIPTGRIGWDRNDFAMDFGYRAIMNDDAGIAHIPSITLSMFKFIELSFAFDIQPDYNYGSYNNDDFLTGFKLRLPTSSTAIALGFNMHLINFDHDDDHNQYNTFQPYIAITYPGNFFTMPAETTITIGKTFYSGKRDNTNIDFGMGFDINLLPSVFNNVVHLVIDFANYGYSDDAWPGYGGAEWRGVFNVGFRFNLSSIPAFSKYKFVLDAAFNDILDSGQRSFTIGAVFGIPLI